MPHLIDYAAIEDKIFVLIHLCGGSPLVCLNYKIGRSSKVYDAYDWLEYQGRLKVIVSNNLIEIAIKVRMLEDFIRLELDEDDILDPAGIDLKKKDEEARSGLEIGRFVEGQGTLTLRESFNKIVHATDAKLIWAEPEDTEEEVEWWCGEYSLFGRMRGKVWHVELYVADWCLAVRKYIDLLHQDIEWKYILRRDE